MAARSATSRAERSRMAEGNLAGLHGAAPRVQNARPRTRCPALERSGERFRVLHASPWALRSSKAWLLPRHLFMNITDTILARRSVRSYLPEQVDSALVRSLLESAVLAPSATNTQPWVFAVVQDAERLKRWSDLAKRRLLDSLHGEAELGRYGSLLRDEAFNIFYDARTLVVIGAPHSRFSQADCWLAAENLMLSARAAGLGSCCIGFALDLLNSEAIKAELNMPARAEVVAAIIVGYARQFPRPVVRTPPKVTAWLADAGDALQATKEQRYAREHPAGFLASRRAPPVSERAGHPLIHDDPGFGAQGQRHLSEGERELSLATPLPEAIMNRLRARSHDDPAQGSGGGP